MCGKSKFRSTNQIMIPKKFRSHAKVLANKSFRTRKRQNDISCGKMRAVPRFYRYKFCLSNRHGCAPALEVGLQQGRFRAGKKKKSRIPEEA